MLVVLHANWYQGSLHLWGESARKFVLLEDRDTPVGSTMGDGSTKPAREEAIERITDLSVHPYACSGSELEALLSGECSVSDGILGDVGTIDLRLPRDLLGPWPSDRLASAVGGIEARQDTWLGPFAVPTIELSPENLLGNLLEFSDVISTKGMEHGHSINFGKQHTRRF